MIGDFGRETSIFGTRKRYEGLNFYSGRAVLASDLNEESQLQKWQRETALIDVIGHVGVPKQQGGFRILTVAGKMPRVTAGDFYVHGARFVQPVTRSIPGSVFQGLPANQDILVVGQFFKAAEDHLLEPFLRDPGLGGPDTAGRRRPAHRFEAYRTSELAAANFMSQSALMDLIEAGNTIQTPISAPRDGRAGFFINAAHVPDDDDCLIHQEAGFTGQTNSNYRIEIHQGGGAGTATFKWAREDVRARVRMADEGLFLEAMPTDDHRAMAPGQTVEIKGEHAHENNKSGVLGIIEELNPDGSVVFSDTITDAMEDQKGPWVITRWDHTHAGNEKGIQIMVDAVALEKGVEVRFEGNHMEGDYWHCAARVVIGDILWPPNADDAAEDGLVRPFNWGPLHAALARVRIDDAGGVTVIEDLRPQFPELTNLTADDVTVRDTPHCTFAGDTVQDALEDLCARIEDNVCRIRVRPDALGPNTSQVYRDWDRLPTLEATCNRLNEILQKFPVERGQQRDPEPFARHISIEFTAGEYVWPAVEKFFARDLARFTLVGCAGAPVTIEFDAGLTVDRCLNVTLRDLNLIFGKGGTGLNVLGGKSVRIDNCLIRQPLNDSNAVVTLQAGRRIKVTDTRILVDNSRNKSGLKPGLHLWDTMAQTHLDGVSSNGALIVGPLMPTVNDVPSEAMISAAEDGSIKTPFEPLNRKRWSSPTLSQTTCRIVGCRFLSVVPGQVMSSALRDWVEIGQFDPSKQFSFQNRAFSTTMASRVVSRGRSNLRIPELLELVDGSDVLLPEKGPIYDFRLDRAPESLSAPFRHIEVLDSEILKGPSILVGETVSVRNTRFPQWKMRSTTVGDALLDAKRFSSAVWRALQFLAMTPGTDSRRRLRPVCLSVARVTSLSGNVGSPFEMNDRTDVWPLMVDFSPPEEELDTELELSADLPDMIRHKILFLHQRYLSSR